MSRIRPVVAAAAAVAASLLVAPPSAQAGDTADAANCVSQREFSATPEPRRMSTVERAWKVTGKVVKTNYHGEYLYKTYSLCKGDRSNYLLVMWDRNDDSGRYFLYVGAILAYD